MRVGKVFAAGEHAAEQQPGIDGGDFALKGSFSSVEIHKVIEEAVLVVNAVGEEIECGAHTRDDRAAGNEASFIGNAQRGESKARCGDAGDVVVVEFTGRAAVFDEPGIGVGLLPEIQTAGLFVIVEQSLVVKSELVRRLGGNRRQKLLRKKCLRSGRGAE